MKIALFFLISICLTTAAFSQKKIRRAFVHVEDAGSEKPVFDAQIINLNSKINAVSNKNGDAFLYITEGDSLEILSNGYELTKVAWTGISRDTTYNIHRSSIVLSEVVVRPTTKLSSKEENLYFLENTLTSEQMRKKVLREAVQVGLGISINIDALYELLSKQGKADRKLADIKIKDAKENITQLRFDEYFTTDNIELQSSDYKEFLQYCSFTSEFVLNANDYDLRKEIRKCYASFSKSQ